MNCSMVTVSLWVGSNPAEESDILELRSMRISAVLSLQAEEDVQDQEPGWEKSAAEAEGLTYRNVAVVDYDSLDLRWKLPACVRTLHELLAVGHHVYLHCTAGVSRSPTVAAAYLYWCLNWPLERALDHLKDARPCCPLGDVIRRAKRPAEFQDA